MKTKPQLYIDQVSRMLDPRFREIEPEQGALGCTNIQVRKIDADKRTVTAVVSTSDIDRYEEIVEPEAFRKWLPEFMNNPVLLAGHTHTGWNGEATVIGKWVDMQITKNGLVGTAEFAKTPLAEEYWQLYLNGHMRAFSVGWLTHAWEIQEFELSKGVTKKIRVFTEVELLEVSAVAVPANRAALARAASAAAANRQNTGDGNKGDEGDKVGDEKMLDALTEMVLRVVVPVVEETINQSIENHLTADPGSKLHTLMIDVAESMQRASGTQAVNDSDVTPDPTDGIREGLAALANV